jgi:hypothetical protein
MKIEETLWSTTLVSVEEMTALRATLFRILYPVHHQNFTTEEESRILIDTMEAQSKWLSQRGKVRLC